MILLIFTVFTLNRSENEWDCNLGILSPAFYYSPDEKPGTIAVIGLTIVFYNLIVRLLPASHWFVY